MCLRAAYQCKSTTSLFRSRSQARAYVERVAKHLDSQGVLVFYDKFEEATLWGKNLYTHLRDVYENKALFTVMFISQHYREKLWPRHSYRAAQARGLASNEEYILPAFFDESIEVPGLSKTTGQISLRDGHRRIWHR